MSKPMILDLFSGAGGCAKGYQLAGFYVVGVDLNPQPHYCGDEFYQDDALMVLDLLLAGGIWHGYRLQDVAALHASPPCQGYSRSLGIARIHGVKEHPLLIGAVRWRLEASGKPWVIENVEGSDLPDALELCGSMFGLPIRRHRWFSSSLMLFGPGPCRHSPGFYNAIGGKIRGYGQFASGKTYLDGRGVTRKREGYYKLSVGYTAMGIDWMSLAEMSQAVPPPYTEWIGWQLREVLVCA
jgi:DNA (cytosine-5)-methyltransferase 1